MDSQTYAFEEILPLEQADENFMKIQDLIESKRQFLISKRNDIGSIVKQNEFLAEVKDDYNRYYNYIAEQKREQIKAFELLQKYVSELKQSGILSEQNIEDSKMEERKIMKELSYIKNKLDKIISETDEIQEVIENK